MRTVAEGKTAYFCRIKAWVVECIEHEEVNAGIYGGAGDFVQAFIYKFIRGETLKRAPVTHEMHLDKIARKWHMDAQLMNTLDWAIHTGKLGPYRSIQQWLDETLTRYYLGHEIKFNNL